ncbi:rhodanese-like domain-containing protein [Gaetbulibacter sp. M240]|uniref:rhodanese-like domain-containing protein n=1 Tax=Gaetbulibacter sp. M240 TaxID=3126511 RepID=UPI00374EC4E1
MRHFFNIILSLLLTVTLFSCNNGTAQEEVKDLSPEAFSEAITGKNVQLIDVRTPDEYDSGHIPNAKNIDYFNDNFQTSLKILDTLQPVFIYCRSGNRSGKSVADFKNAGFTKIYNLEGGILNWQSKNLQTTSP